MFTSTKFLDVPIGHLFWAHGTVWARTNTKVGTCVSASRSGSCDFTIEPEDEYVLAINGIKLEILLKKTYPKETARIAITNPKAGSVRCTGNDDCPLCYKP